MDKVSSAVTGAAVKSLIQPHPGTGILKYWQGIVEIILRIVSLVLLFILFICCCVALGNLNVITSGSRSIYHGAPGWLLFVVLVTMPVEGLILASRFLNFGFVTKFSTIVHIVDIVVSFVTVGAIFCGTIPSAVYAGRLNASDVFAAGGAMGGVAAFGFFAMIIFVGLGVFMILSIVLKWPNGPNGNNYSVPEATGGSASFEDE